MVSFPETIINPTLLGGICSTPSQFIINRIYKAFLLVDVSYCFVARVRNFFREFLVFCHFMYSAM